MEPEDVYEDRLPARVKHDILQRYLNGLAYKVLSSWKSLSYIDAFSGPWKHRTEDFSDTSFGIALKVLQGVRSSLSTAQSEAAIRCAFVEKNRDSYKKLSEVGQLFPAIHIETHNKTFQKAIPELTKFVENAPDTFVFTLIDPKGWSDADLTSATSLLRRDNSEVLINFMTDFFRRGAATDKENNRKRAAKLLGSDENLEYFLKLDDPDEREFFAIRCYEKHVREVGRYKYVASTPVLFSTEKRTKYHLVYGTRSIVGLEVFRTVERQVTEKQQAYREAEAARKKGQGGQGVMFGNATHGNSYLYDLKKRYNLMARAEIVELLENGDNLEYDELFASALSYPLTWESDLKKWLEDLRRNGLVQYIGLGGKKKPKIREGHSIVYTGRATKD